MKSVLILVVLLTALCHTEPINQTIDCMRQYINSLKADMNDHLFQIFKKSYPNTLQTTIQHYNLTQGYQSTYIITGDIQAMWLRDSTNQFLPYIRMQNKCPNIQKLSRGLINTQAQFIMVDGYTNAFKRFQTSTRKRPSYLNDKTQTLLMGIPVDLCKKKQYATQAIWERKFEIDSLASFLRLSYEHYKNFKNIDFLNIKYIRALRRLITVLQEQSKDQLYEKQNNSTFYTFYRDARQLAGGHIKASRYTGMIKTGFRPSDDPNQLPYNVPGNAMASTFLKYVAEYVLTKIPKQSVFFESSKVLRSKMNQLSDQIREGIYRYGLITKNDKKMFAYQVDGMGNYRAIDDSNLPSLLSLPYFQFIDKNDQIYLNTRRYLLSNQNQYYYFSGKISGIGSSHTPVNNIWPLAVMTQILTSTSDQQIINCMDTLIISAVNDLMHESFSVSNPERYTRSWFAWANSFFGETVLTLLRDRPSILKKVGK